MLCAMRRATGISKMSVRIGRGSDAGVCIRHHTGRIREVETALPDLPEMSAQARPTRRQGYLLCASRQKNVALPSYLRSTLVLRFGIVRGGTMNQQITPLSREVPIAVIGAGTMGSGIALVAATAGHSVLLYDVAPGAAAAGCKRQRADLEKLVARGRLTAEECGDRLSRLQPVEGLPALASAG